MRENIRALGVLTSDLLVRDDFCTFVLFPVFHGFIERRVAEEVACGCGG